MIYSEIDNVRKSKQTYDYLIVGAGITGATLSRIICEHGKTCLVLERRRHVAGNCFDKEINGIRVHRYGAHIFHTSNKEVWDFVNRFASFNSFINSPVANYKGKIYSLPFNMNTFSQLWGIVKPNEAKAIIESQRVHYDHEPYNLEEQALTLVGKDIYEKLIRGYTEKQWGRLCSELPASIIKRIPLRFYYDNNYFNDCYQGIPEEGYTKLVENLLSCAKVCLNVDFLENRDEYENLANTVIYTGPIDEYFSFSEGRLQYRSLKFEDEMIEESNYQGVAVMNYTDVDCEYTRIIEHKHFEFGKQPHTIITREYPIEWVPGIEPYYPINDCQNMELFKKYNAKAATVKNTYFCGRLAEYKYYNMDEAIFAAMLLAKRVLSI